MSELRNLLSDTTERVLANLDTNDFSAAWAKVAESGLANVLVTEEEGGFGGSWEDALVVIRAVGARATALPIAEAILASCLCAKAQLALPEGALTLSPQTEGIVAHGKFSGAMHRVPFGGSADYIAAIAGDVLLIAAREHATVELHENIAGEGRETLRFLDAPVQASPLDGWDDARLFGFCALLRSAQMAGALDAALELAIRYTRERQQFGKALSSFQAIQQQLAVFAEEVAACDMAAAASYRAVDRGDAEFEIACAKLRANRAARMSTEIAHQVHGAMGFTAEYSLHHLTRRLWAWSSEFGNERHWADKLGARVAARGAANFWADMTA